jgi:hypothetical protein
MPMKGGPVKSSTIKPFTIKPFTMIAVAVFTVVALLHAVRFVAGWEVTIAGPAIPVWLRAPACLIAGGLDVMVWRESRP